MVYYIRIVYVSYLSFAQEKARWDTGPFSSLAKWPRHVTITYVDKRDDDDTHGNEKCTTIFVHKTVPPLP